MHEFVDDLFRICDPEHLRQALERLRPEDRMHVIDVIVDASKESERREALEQLELFGVK